VASSRSSDSCQQHTRAPAALERWACAGQATLAAQLAGRSADIDAVRTGRRRIWSGALTAAALSLAAALLCLVAAASAVAADYGPGAPIPFLLFPADNAWNTRVDTLPLDPRSADYIAAMNPSRGLHPDFGTVWQGAPIGIPYVVVPGDQPRVPVSFVYADESDPGPYPVPPDAPIEGGASSTGDRHVLVLDADDQVLYELFDARRDGAGWWAGSGAVFDLTSNALRPGGWTSADAAGLPILPGLARYDEAVTEGVIDHALRFTVARTQRAYVYPATHYASSLTDTSLPPMGLRVRLRADFDLSGLPPQARAVVQALKTYGMMVADNGSDWYVSGAPDARWDDDDLHSLSAVKGSDFEVVDSRALLPGAFYLSLPAAGVVREGGLWSSAGLVYDPAGAAWTATVDYDDGSGPTGLPVAADKALSLAHRWADDGGRRVRVEVANDLDRHAAASVSVTVTNIAPRVYGGASVRVRRGALFARRCSFTDPGADAWTGTVSYGDGTGARPLRLHADKTFVLNHRFRVARGRVCTVTVKVHDDDGGRGVARFKVTVR
jgi:hypothetical protein